MLHQPRHIQMRKIPARVPTPMFPPISHGTLRPDRRVALGSFRQDRRVALGPSHQRTCPVALGPSADAECNSAVPGVPAAGAWWCRRCSCWAWSLSSGRGRWGRGGVGDQVACWYGAAFAAPGPPSCTRPIRGCRVQLGDPGRPLHSSERTCSSSQTQPRWKSGSCSRPR
jgi:hypothetical protein